MCLAALLFTHIHMLPLKKRIQSTIKAFSFSSSGVIGVESRIKLNGPNYSKFSFELILFFDYSTNYYRRPELSPIKSSVKFALSFVFRCAITNRNLQHTLTACSDANGVLKARIELLESELDKSESDRNKQREIYHEKLAALSRNVAEKQRERDICERDNQVEITRSVLEVERRYVEMLNKKEVDFGKKMEEVRNKLEHEIMTVFMFLVFY